MQLENVQDLLKARLLLASFVSLIVFRNSHSIEVNDRWNIERLLRDSLQEGILDHDFKLFSLLIDGWEAS